MTAPLIDDRLDAAVAELADAWRAYGMNARVMDGHAQHCAYRPNIMALTLGGPCSCGFSRVERAIRELTREGNRGA